MFISPMLLQTAPVPFSNSDYIYEPKIDGHRLIYSQQAGQVRLYTRHDNDCTRQYPELQLPFADDVILDGEVACVDPATGVSDFEAVMSRFQARRQGKIQQLTGTLPAYYAIFDILQYKGNDLTGLPLLRRKEILAGLSLPSGSFGVVPYVDGAGEALFEQIETRGMEGVVGKRKNSLYEVGRRSHAWQKVINWTYADVYITGYRKQEFGWLAAVPGPSDKLRPAGVIEFGVSPVHKQAFRGVAGQLVTGEDKEFVHLAPKLRAKVRMRNWTKSGMLRSPVFTEFIV
ncbi:MULTISPECIES: ATP-dependent DNA ligase [unclassified Paenibacillus]|uniref:ATP-dependent DNA ligase n=1 Tax=unclassified Paenibacillus TaxID=185978 RepID=UPI00240645C6|nr:MULTISPECIES: ATP-dependent DNA ligase [unclassified Paenibacillus]MDF9845468.1 DNA ligase-1 [Paenibacillus sp. PastF-2]MDF9852052.1 DNA ligase-1 [Paenibacillus sp. PastM-2]MDF9858627.1 DNA ligase-1 [Paenibacillus sp. PastF-1]MDH6483893.1 DNA ligase-1 [Paenibacillus sp. PastH-2]MDH6511262.1 DNA ligase-1 [Paenibacillus sp. PastM-3]